MREFFTYIGRLNRRPYFFRGLALVSIFKFLTYVLKTHRMAFSIPILIVICIVTILTTAFAWFQSIKRLHDIDRSGWNSLLAFIPYVNIIFCLYLSFKKGTAGPNAYGDDPLSKYQTTTGTTPPEGGELMFTIGRLDFEPNSIKVICSLIIGWIVIPFIFGFLMGKFSIEYKPSTVKAMGIIGVICTYLIWSLVQKKRHSRILKN